MFKPPIENEKEAESPLKRRRMHVVFDMTFPRRLKTGTTVYANELVAALRERDICRVTCLAAPMHVRKRKIWKLCDGIRTIFWIQVVLPLKLHFLKADVLHAPSFFAPLLWCPCPVILNVFDTSYLVPSQRLRGKLFNIYSRVFIAGAVWRARFISTLSNASRKDILSAYRVPDERVRVIYPGVNLRYQPRSEVQLAKFRQKYQLDRPFFLFVGVWEPRKNLPRLIEAFSIFCKDVSQRYELILVGPQGSGAADVLRALNNPAIAGRVRPLGFIADEEMPSMYAAADAFVFPTLGEGFGLPIIEAMACGTPVITSGLSCLPEVAGDAALLVDPESPADIARAMRDVIQSYVRQGLRSKGLRRAQQFNWQNAAEETEQAYLDALT